MGTFGRRVVGYRFHPNDEELISHFLKRKMEGFDSLVNPDIPEIDIYKHEPSELPRLASRESNDQVWYFFCRRDYKFRNSRRVNRSTKIGQWKSTGQDRLIKARRTKDVIGMKKTLVFYKRSGKKNVKTNWVIHEYRSNRHLSHQREFVVCKLKKKRTDSSAGDAKEWSCDWPSDGGNYPVKNPITKINSEPEERLQLGCFLPSNGMNFNQPSALQPQMYMGQHAPSDDLVITDDISSDDLNEFRFQFDINEQEEDLISMADAFLECPDEDKCELYVQNLSSGTEIGVVERKVNRLLENVIPKPESMSWQFLEALNVYRRHANSRKFRHMQTFYALVEILSSLKEYDLHGFDPEKITVTEVSFGPLETNKYIFLVERARNLDEVPDTEASAKGSDTEKCYSCENSQTSASTKTWQLKRRKGSSYNKKSVSGDLSGIIYVQPARTANSHFTAIDLSLSLESTAYTLSKEGLMWILRMTATLIQKPKSEV